MLVRQEFQVMSHNFDQIQRMAQQGIIRQWSFNEIRDPTISIVLNDHHTTVCTGGWLVQDTEGRWWGMGNDYHRILEHYGKIRKE